MSNTGERRGRPPPLPDREPTRARPTVKCVTQCWLWPHSLGVLLPRQRSPGWRFSGTGLL
eukprot:6384443-Pyramimonas_sp.AAC.1